MGRDTEDAEAEPRPELSEKVLRLHNALAAAHIPHAFGGALASDYYRVPRATIDIDIGISAAGRVRSVAYEHAEIPILSAEDIVVFKVLFDRSQDWADIEAICELQGEKLDVAYASAWFRTTRWRRRRPDRTLQATSEPTRSGLIVRQIRADMHGCLGGKTPLRESEEPWS